jgi:hypothetical protein
MSKFVIFRIESGNFESGFPVTLEIGDNNTRPSTVIQAILPPAPEILQHYKNWQLSYRQLGLHFRELIPIQTQVTNVSIIQDCREFALVLSNSLNIWLESEAFRPVKEAFLRCLQPSEEIRVVIQTENIQLRQLPSPFNANISTTRAAPKSRF